VTKEGESIFHHIGSAIELKEFDIDSFVVATSFCNGQLAMKCSLATAQLTGSEQGTMRCWKDSLPLTTYQLSF
jgi:hypothetical protein